MTGSCHFCCLPSESSLVMVSDGIHYDTARQEKKDGVIVALTQLDAWFASCPSREEERIGDRPRFIKMNRCFFISWSACLAGSYATTENFADLLVKPTVSKDEISVGFLSQIKGGRVELNFVCRGPGLAKKRGDGLNGLL